MRALALAFLLLASVPLFAGTPKYLWGEVTLPEGALAGLPARAQTLGIPSLTYTQDGPYFTGVKDEAELLAGETYLIYDPPYFLLCLQTGSTRAVLRGSGRAQLIAGGVSDVLIPPPEGFFELLSELGLLPEGETIELVAKDVPLKLPPPPEGSRLDPVLWALVNHPDWIGFSRDYALERVGLRVRVVVEKEGELSERFEPYILSSSDGLAELLVPIPLLPALGGDPAVREVRPPYLPHPAEG
ncbi:MAG: hypothetical protein XD60_1418 [Acetothermia bacterium 64_32]|nr:MAG: hypothetical protein XD60_1418 [Acetothermia bacterium 64_32]HAF71330.1 hypothetical protein [Candidatus Acetothermia bacterium]